MSIVDFNFLEAANHLIDANAFIYHVSLGLCGQAFVRGDVSSPCGFVNHYEDMVVLLVKNLPDVHGEVKAVIFDVGLDFAKRSH